MQTDPFQGGLSSFYIEDQAPSSSILFPARWRLVARDAFNGRTLWTRPIRRWHPHLWWFRQGPRELSRRLVAVGERVHATLSIRGPVQCLDAATGETLHTYANTAGTEEIVCTDDHLYLAVGPTDPERARRAGEERVADELETLTDWASEHRGRAWDMSRADDVAGLQNVSETTFTDGTLNFTSQPDARLNLDRAGKLIDAEYDLIAFRMYVSQPERATVYYWSTGEDWQGYNVQPIREGWHTYCVDLNSAQNYQGGGGGAAHRRWGGAPGKIRRLRFDPVQGAGVEVKIDWVRLLKADEARKRELERLGTVGEELVALHAETGRSLWRRDAGDLMAQTLAVDDGRVFYQNKRGIVCVDADTGETRWRHERRMPRIHARPPMTRGSNVMRSNMNPLLLIASATPPK